jgi:hypothetical protein
VTSTLRFFLVYALLAPPVFLFSFRSSGAFRIELGGADESYRTNDAWGRPYEDKGPYRVRRGERYMTYFAARMAYQDATILVPDVVRGGDVEIRLKMHRYGEPGIVRLFANGIALDELVFEEDSYPWGIRRVTLPGDFAKGGDLRLELRSSATEEHGRLPPGAVAAFDWIEIAPSSDGRLLPTTSQWLFALGLPLLVFVAVRGLGMGRWLPETSAGLSLAAVAGTHAWSAGSAAAAVSRLWIAFPIAVVVYLILRNLVGMEGASSRRLSSALALVLLASSTVIFWPDHLPPDVRPHLRQLRRIETTPWKAEALWEIASSYGKDGRTLSLGRYHPDADYVAPYPLGSYFFLHAARKLVDEPRFLVEYLAILCAAVLVLLAYILTRQLFPDPLAPSLAAMLLACDLVTWHHASRAHMPALFGQVFFVTAVVFLLARERDLLHFRTAILFALLSMAATLAYSATLLHFVVFMVWLVLLEVVSARSIFMRPEARGFLAASVAGTLGSFAVFYRHFLGAGGDKLALLSSEGYRAPASFLFLRNQVRDTARVLRAGYPLWWFLATPALVRLHAWTSRSFARRVVWAWTLAFLTFVVLKDPLVVPRLLLQIKEHLFVACLLSSLGGMTLAKLAQWGAKGKLAVALILAVALALRVGDYAANADMIRAPVQDLP